MITVLAGVNGAGKSSIGGSSLRAAGTDYFNPDEETRRLLSRRPELTLEQANSRAWEGGVARLREAISQDTDWVFESTLGGRTITDLLLEAIDRGIAVRVWYCGLDSPEKHIERVQARVARGGHDIPDERIHYRFVASLKNLCLLAPRCTTLAVYDNSCELGPSGRPQPQRVLQAQSGAITFLSAAPPRWTRPIIGALLPP